MRYHVSLNLYRIYVFFLKRDWLDICPCPLFFFSTNVSEVTKNVIVMTGSGIMSPLLFNSQIHWFINVAP
jgi:hypothetical protein